MAVVGFGFTKMLIERKGEIKGRINIKNNVSIKEVSTVDMSLGKIKQKGLRVDFEYKSEYEPKIAQIVFEGNVLDVSNDKTAEDILKAWKKDKKLPNQFMEPIINAVLNRCNVQALVMSKELNLPPPIQLPRVSSNITAGAKK